MAFIFLKKEKSIFKEIIFNLSKISLIRFFRIQTISTTWKMDLISLLKNTPFLYKYFIIQKVVKKFSFYFYQNLFLSCFV